MKVDRRKFLQLGAWGGTSLVLPDRLKLARMRRKPWNEQSAKVTRKNRNPNPTTCSLCDNHCGLMTFREGDRVVMMLGNGDHPMAGGKLCAKAYGQLDRLYDPDRVLTPLLRDGERGAGKWKAVSWEEAYALLTEKLAPVYASQGANLAYVNGQDELLTESFLSLFPRATKVETSRDFLLKRFRQQLYGTPVCYRKYQDCRYILNFADDPFRTGDAYVTEVRSLVDGLVENGLTLVTVAARLSQTGGKSNAWHPVQPQHYGDVAKAVARVMLINGWYDRKSLAETGMKAADLLTHLEVFTPEAVGKNCELPVKAINDMAYQLSHRQPAVVIFGTEVFHAEHGWENACAIELLNVLCGAVRLQDALSYEQPVTLGAEPASSVENTVSTGWFFQKLKDRGAAQVLISYQANPVYQTYDGKLPTALLEDLRRISFYVAMDTHVHETSRYADLILPVATELESWGLYSQRLNRKQWCVSLRQPVSRPTDEILLLRQAKIKKLELFDPSMAPVASGREFNQIVLDLGRKLAGEASTGPFSHDSIISYLEALVKQVPGLEVSGGLAYLKKTGFFVVTNKNNAASQSARLRVGDLGNTQLTPPEAYGETDFFLIPFDWHVLDSRTGNSKYLVELRHDNPLWIHPRRAKHLGIAEGDAIKVRTALGTVNARAWITEAIHPGCAAMAAGHGHTHMGRVATAQPISQVDPMTKSLLSRKALLFMPFTFRLDCWDKKEPVWWKDKGNGCHINPILRGQQIGQAPGITLINPLIRVIKG
ncbi:MAG: molybdopterin-dependent oxidoreductase [Deltaproteobacteria bacterium]|nr:molybdopterin-dependent oxidoreductase [Candidatus Anaeroferrophillus wilburensis]MBN2888337.1 molybdopterin-dependent oxidoreductase [Deltaproteobacteria bacterium]